MLKPDERAKAIKIMAMGYQSQMQYNHQQITDMLMFGHKGFAAFSDGELLRAISTFAKQNNNYDAQQFIAGIALDKFVLE